MADQPNPSFLEKLNSFDNQVAPSEFEHHSTDVLPHHEVSKSLLPTTPKFAPFLFLFSFSASVLQDYTSDVGRIFGCHI